MRVRYNQLSYKIKSLTNAKTVEWNNDSLLTILFELTYLCERIEAYMLVCLYSF